MSMANPEVLPQAPVPEQQPQAEVPVEAPQSSEQASQSQTVQTPAFQVLQPTVPAAPVQVPQTDDNALVVPVQDEEELKHISKGDASDSKTWFGVFWLFKIKKAIHEGLRTVFRKSVS